MKRLAMFLSKIKRIFPGIIRFLMNTMIFLTLGFILFSVFGGNTATAERETLIALFTALIVITIGITIIQGKIKELIEEIAWLKRKLKEKEQ